MRCLLQLSTVVPLCGLVSAKQSLSTEQLKTMHALLDHNQDGSATILEMMSQGKEFNHIVAIREVAEMWQDLDKDGDSKLSLEEFKHDADAQFERNHMEPEDLAQMLEVAEAKFRLVDVDGDGFVTQVEAPALLFPDTDEGVMDIEVREQMRLKDGDGDGRLSFAELYEIDAGHEDADKAHIKADFATFDGDKDGYISLTELRFVESGRFYVLEAARAIFEAADTSGDGNLSLEELLENKAHIPTEAMNLLYEWIEHHEL